MSDVPREVNFSSIGSRKSSICHFSLATYVSLPLIPAERAVSIELRSIVNRKSSPANPQFATYVSLPLIRAESRILGHTIHRPSPSWSSMAQLKTIRLPVSANLKLLLVLLALTIVAGTLWFTQGLVSELKDAERNTINFYANTLQVLLSSPQENTSGSEITSELALRAGDIIYFPLIVATPDGAPMSQLMENGSKTFQGWVRNVEYDTTSSIETQTTVLMKQVQEMKESYDPLPIYSVTEYTEDVMVNDSVVPVQQYDTTLVAMIYYDDSAAVKQLQLLPYVEIILISMFILIGYISFSHIKRSEQSNIWVGMAKETAHQLGTPLSSLMGWIELLRIEPENSEQVLEAVVEMGHDVDRLNTVAQRFSKIGSASQLKRVDIGEVIDNVTTYFQRRLPHLGKTVTLKFDRPDAPLYALINIELINWVFENLIRNAADAIERRQGEILFKAWHARNMIVVEVSDNGKGIDPKIRKDIFRPGFSTKQRGWGLGLSLAKRIVEEYHGGKIFVKETSSAGTTFTIRIKEAPEDVPAASSGESRA